MIIAKRLLPALRNLSDEDAVKALKQNLEGKTQSAAFWGANKRPTDRDYSKFQSE